MADHVWVKNTDHGAFWACPTDYLPVAIAKGWEETDAPETDDSHLYDPKPAKKAAPRKSGD